MKLAVLIKRGYKALPIEPNYVGKSIPTARTDRIRVRVGDDAHKAADRVVLYSMVEPTMDPASAP